MMSRLGSQAGGPQTSCLARNRARSDDPSFADAVQDVEPLRTFLDQNNSDAARRALALIWTTIERLQDFPALGMRAEEADIRQVVIRFGARSAHR
jgi:hypothetical protein